MEVYYPNEEANILCEAYETGIALRVDSKFQDLVMDELVVCLTDDSHDSDERNLSWSLPQLIKTFGTGSPGRQFMFDRILEGE